MASPVADRAPKRARVGEKAEEEKEEEEEAGPGGAQVYVDLGLPIGAALTRSYTFFSPVAAGGAEGDGYVVGVDEAGRGPVLGPMVYAVCFCRESHYEQLGAVGFADSKQLTQEQRERLFGRLQAADLREHAGWAIRCIAPQDISQCMLRRTKYSLNALAHDATIQLLRDALERGIRITRVFVDTVGPPAPYQRRLQELFPQAAVTVAKKADSIYPIVSAASICAKVVRDAHLDHWAFAEAPLQGRLLRAYGSGYPGDPATVKWLRDSLDPVFGYPGIIRFSWSTCARLLDERAARVVWPDEAEAEAGRGRPAARPPRLAAMLAARAADARPQSRFLARNRAVQLGAAL